MQTYIPFLIISRLLEDITSKNFVFNYFFFSENRAVFEVMWKNILERAGHRRQYGAYAFHAG